MCADLRIVEAPVGDIIETEMWPLLEANHAELTSDKGLMELAPDVACYRNVEAAGALLALLAYDGDKLVGYSVNIVSQNMNYRHLVCASNLVLFVLKEYRAMVGLRLMAATSRAAKARGAALVTWHAKPGTALEAILRRRKRCKVEDVLFTEEL